MKACVLHGIGDLRFEVAPAPTPAKGEVLIRIKASGICGSDIPRVFTKGTYCFPTIPGHEFAGQIVAVGEGTNRQLVGRKAAVFPLLPCMKCEACQIGEYAQCKDYNYFGSRCNGGFAEYIAVPVWNLVMTPDILSYEEAAMAEPAAVAIHALRQAGIEIGDNVAIFGAGPIGLMLGQWAEAWGAGKVLLVDIDEGKIAFAKEMGFQYVWNSKDGDPVKWITEMTGDRGADLAIEGAGVSSSLEQCLGCVRPFGRIVAMGNPAGDMKISQKAYWELLRKQLKISGTWNSSFVSLPKNDWDLAIFAMAQNRINAKPFITHRFSLEQCNEALLMMRDRTAFFNKVMFTIE
ncbi:MAG: galactitol-1-phosphate 5-dehydrogenase [Clostridiales bacterium]|nr:galactitol-1-phosphate 5-dehydrogenase [Clostridiales bacterium]